MLGTSNSIIKGRWFDGFKSTYPGSVTRLSLGGAPFIQLSRFLDKIQSNSYDYIVVDTTPNDESFSSKLGSPDFFNKMYIEFIECIAGLSKVVLLQLPTERLWSNPNRIRLFQQEVVSNFNGHFIAIDSILTHICEKYPVNARIFVDNFHLRTDISFQIGAVLGRTIQKIERRAGGGEYLGAPFSVVYGISDSSEKFAFKSSLIECDFNVIRRGESMRLKEEVFCLGLYINSSQCWGMLRFKNRAGFEKFVYSFYDIKNERSIIRFQPLTNGFLTSSVSVVHPAQVFDIGFQTPHPFQPPFFSSIEGFISYSGDLNLQPKLNAVDVPRADATAIFCSAGLDALAEVICSGSHFSKLST